MAEIERIGGVAELDERPKDSPFAADGHHAQGDGADRQQHDRLVLLSEAQSEHDGRRDDEDADGDPDADAEPVDDAAKLLLRHRQDDADDEQRGLRSGPILRQRPPGPRGEGGMAENGRRRRVQWERQDQHPQADGARQGQTGGEHQVEKHLKRQRPTDHQRRLEARRVGQIGQERQGKRHAGRARAVPANGEGRDEDKAGERPVGRNDAADALAHEARRRAANAELGAGGAIHDEARDDEEGGDAEIAERQGRRIDVGVRPPRLLFEAKNVGNDDQRRGDRAQNLDGVKPSAPRRRLELELEHHTSTAAPRAAGDPPPPHDRRATS